MPDITLTEMFTGIIACLIQGNTYMIPKPNLPDLV